MIELIGIILELFFEIIAQIVLEFGLALGVESFAHSLRDSRKSNPIPAYIGIAVIGILFGFGSSFVFSDRIFRNPPVKGVSLFLSPLLAGAAMHFWGKLRRDKGHRTSRFATFFGGALFAFSFAAVRWFMVGR